MNRQTHWQNVYETKAEVEVSWFQAEPATSLRLIQESGFGPDARIIDVGGGQSRLVDRLLERGYRHVTVLDIAEKALSATRRRLKDDAEHVGWVVADITCWVPSGVFDLWHDRAVFHFLTDPCEREVYISAMAAAIRPGGQAIMGTFALDGPEKCSGLPVCRYDADTLAAELGPWFRLVGSCTEGHLTPAGKIQSFQFCRFVRV